MKIVNSKAELQDEIMNAINIKGPCVNLNYIDTSRIKNMRYLFLNSAFNGDISKWDVSNVTNMNGMFFGSYFNQDISKWDVSKVENMSWMFRDSGFNNNISKWDV